MGVFEGVESVLSLLSQDLGFSALDVRSRFSAFHSTLLDAIQAHTCSLRFRTKNNNVYASLWANQELVRLSRRKHRLLKKQREGVYSATLQERIDQVVSQVNTLESSLQERFRTRQFGPDVDQRARWRNLNRILKGAAPETIQGVSDRGGSYVSDKKLIACAFNEFFSSQGSVPSPSTAPAARNVACSSSLYLRPTSSAEVLRVIQGLKHKKSMGYDGVSVQLVKHCSLTLSAILSPLFNDCIAAGYYPTELKVARVIPIYKSGPRDQLGNYRPISLLSVINKIFEKLLHGRLLDFLSHTDFLFSRQYGFRPSSSTSGCVIDLVDYVYGELDRGNFVSGVFLDLSKAFDSVVFDVLFEKLELAGVRGIALDLFRSYLGGRKQFVEISGEQSGLLKVLRGVPQGSCLGPLLFLVYVNDLSALSLSGRLYLFADDTAIFYSSQDIQENCRNAESDLGIVQDQLGADGLSLNAFKTRVMHFHSPNRVTSSDAIVTLDGAAIEQVFQMKYLGLVLDPVLKWGEHIDSLVTRLRQVVGVLYRTRRLLPRDVRWMVYHTMVHSRISYLVEVWGGATASRLSSLQKIQNRALRNVCSIPFLTPRMTIYLQICSNVLPVRALYEFSVARFVFKCLHGLVHSELSFAGAQHTYSRNRDMLLRPRFLNEITRSRMSVGGGSRRVQHPSILL